MELWSIIYWSPTIRRDSWDVEGISIDYVYKLESLYVLKCLFIDYFRGTKSTSTNYAKFTEK